MIPVADSAEITLYLPGFTENGYTRIPGIYTPAQVHAFHAIYERAVSDWQFTHGTQDTPDAVGGLLERFPREILPAITHPKLLGFAEAVMGPFAQLDSVVVNSDPPLPPGQRGLPVMWHRDRFGSVPPGAYVRPASIVFLTYLQPMTDEVGPLRVVPGSHREARLLAPADLNAPLPDEQLIGTEPGDVVAIHHNLLHSGTRNTSETDRRFLGFILNLSVLRAEDNFSGPNCRALASSAQRDHDRRLLRLLEEDPLIFPRQNSGFTTSHEADWQRPASMSTSCRPPAPSSAGITPGIPLDLYPEQDGHMPESVPLLLVESSWADGRIQLSQPIEAVRSYVHSGKIVILRHALPGHELRSLRQAVFRWGQRTPEITASIRGNSDLRGQFRSWHGRLAWPAGRQPPLRLWHGYAFVLGEDHHPSDATITARVRWMFDAMRDLHQRLTGLQARYELWSPEGALRPQIMHYPSGGGARARERHANDPTIISQIAALSERGHDYHVGGNVFETRDRLVDTSDQHDLGDICLFRSDLWHAVAPVDPEAPLDLESERGRWTAVLPLVASN